MLKTKGNNNLPRHTKKTISQIRSHHKAVILEMGLGRDAGRYHFSHVRPNFGVITNIGTAHFGKLGNSIQATAKSKSVLIRNLSSSGTLLINQDDNNSKLLKITPFKGTIITVGIKNKATYNGLNVRYLETGMSFQVVLNKKRENFFIPTFGRHNVINALFAIAISHRLGFTPAQMRLGLKKFRVPLSRLKVTKLPQNSLLIDDTFNANPQSVKAAADVLENVAKKKRKIIILGSMLELGDLSTAGHQSVGEYLAKKNIQKIYTYGNAARWICKAAVKHGFPAKNVHSFTDRTKLHNELKKTFSPNTVYLVKGSHRKRMTITVGFLARYSTRKRKTRSKRKKA